ncbi:MAG: glycosyltransferase [Clostridiales Family XIII bacterium]|nr:glycosyltransferase [Clostridiales Family XIII bacterium]
MKIFITTTVLREKHGGKTRALLSRAKMLAESGYDVTVVASRYVGAIDDVKRFYLEQGYISDGVKLRDVFEEYRKGGNVSAPSVRNDYRSYVRSRAGGRPPLFRALLPTGSRVVRLRSGKYSLTFTKRGRFLSSIMRVDVTPDDESETSETLFCDPRGMIRRTVLTDTATGAKVGESYYGEDGAKYASMEYERAGKRKALPKSVSIFTGEGAVTYASYKKFLKDRFDSIFADGDIVINDSRVLDWPLLNMNKKVRCVFQIHNSHLSDPSDAGSDTEKSHRLLLGSELSERDRIVVLTVAQRDMIAERHPNVRGNLVVIRHPAKDVTVSRKVKAGNISFVSRLERQKDPASAMRAFALIADDRPDATLHIYGDGELEDELKALNRELGLEGRILFEGFTTDADRVFQESVFSILTSAYEGFGLVLLESLSNGCPFISYDTMFGPSEIADDSCARIVPQGDLGAFADAMLAELDEPHSRKAAVARSKEFSRGEWREQWIGLIEARAKGGDAV